jgi:hypothetical protein
MMKHSARLLNLLQSELYSPWQHRFSWPLRQLDISNAFLHGFLKEDVYMAQPQGFIDSATPGYVCKLHKSLYGLKQAPRAWFERFTSQLENLGFTASSADPSLFTYKSHNEILYLLLYVDDIILTGTSPSLITNLITKLQQTFELKDLGPLHYFLGLQLQYHEVGFSVHQTKYATDLLTKFDMTNCKPSSTPYSSLSRLNQTQGTPLPNPTHFRSLVGALQYLTFTRPDLSFAVNQVCQFMHSPTDTHLVAAKRILRYLKGTLTHGLLFSSKLPHSSSLCRCRLGRKSRRSSLHLRLCCLLRLNPNYLGLEETKHRFSLLYRSRISEPCFRHCKGLLDSNGPQRFGGFSPRSSSLMVRQPLCLNSRLKSQCFMPEPST